MVNLEVKGQLAKLLATEDLIIEHRNVSTASFDVDRRVLTLPRWEKASSEVFDLLIAHEVGHALFTPADDWNDIAEVPGIYINIAEDARIEKLMKHRFGGLPKTFYNGYKKLYDEDFFDIEGEDLNNLSLPDRVNLYFKVGSYVQIPFFTFDESLVVEKIRNADTFEQMVLAAEQLYKLHKQQKEEEEKEETPAPAPSDEEQSSQQDVSSDQQENQPGENDVEETQPEGQSQSESDEDSDGEESEETTEEIIETPNQGGDHMLDQDVKTVDNLSEKLESLANRSSYGEPVYVEIPTVNLKDIVVDNRDIYDYINDYWDKSIHETLNETTNTRTKEQLEDIFFKYPRLQWQEFRRDIQSEVNYMVKEFECKKSAAAYARASTSRTGVLDCTKLHTYKYNEDLFKKVTTIPNGKNHGLVFVLDWSGSMCRILQDTVKQLLSVVMFCDKVNIPFDVYAFTNEWNYQNYKPVRPSAENENQIFIDGAFSMMNMLTSRTSRKELIRQMETLFMISTMSSYNYGTGIPPRVGLSGTPLNEAIVTLKTLLPDFKARTGVEKAHVMVLTDGESCQSRYTRRYDEFDGVPQFGLSRIVPNTNCYLRNRTTGKVSYVGGNDGYVFFTTVLLNDLQDMFPDSTFTGFRILENNSGYFVRQACNYDETICAQWKKTKAVTLTNFGYDRYFIIANNQLQQSTDFTVDEDASKAKIKSAFAKSLKGKKVNKKILGDFIGLIA